MIILVKPQFELPKGDIPDGGVVIDGNLHNKAVNKVLKWSVDNDLEHLFTCASPIAGKKGNKEFLLGFRYGN